MVIFNNIDYVIVFLFFKNTILIVFGASPKFICLYGAILLVCTTGMRLFELRCATEIKQKGKIHYIEDHSCIRRTTTSGLWGFCVSCIWMLTVDPLSPAHRNIRPLWTDFVAEFGNKLVWWSTCRALYPTVLLLMHHQMGRFQEVMVAFTWEESLGALWSKNDHDTKATTQDFLKNIYIQRVIVVVTHQF